MIAESSPPETIKIKYILYIYNKKKVFACKDKIIRSHKVKQTNIYSSKKTRTHFRNGIMLWLKVEITSARKISTSLGLSSVKERQNIKVEKIEKLKLIP